MARSRSLASLLAPCALAAALPAQELVLSRALVDATFTAQAAARGTPPVSTSVAARTDVTNGLSAVCVGPASSADVHATFSRYDQTIHLQLTGSCVANGTIVPGASATLGQPGVLVELAVPRPMVVRFTVRGTSLVGPGAPPSRSVVDVGDDGVCELDFLPRVGVGGVVSDAFVMELPAGLLAIRLAIDVELPSAAVGNQAFCAIAGAGVHIEPAHATVAWEGVSCGSFFAATPMLDGVNVRCSVWHPHTAAVGVLVLGTSRTVATVPVAPWCPLLVTPDIVLPMTQGVEALLPLGTLGTLGLGELFAQGVLLMPAMPWQPELQLYTSARAHIGLR